MDKTIGGNLSRIKVRNQFAIKEAIYKFGPISRIEVAEKLDLTVPTITTNVSLMISRGLIAEIENKNGPRTVGRKTMLIDVDSTSGFFLGVEIRGALRRVVIVDIKGKVVASAFDNVLYSEYEDVIRNVSELIVKMLRKKKIILESITGIGICTPGIIDNTNGILVIHPGYKWANKNIVQDLVRLIGYNGPVSVENNAIARSYGLNLFNHNKVKNANSLAYMYVSTGIACPLLNDIRDHFGVVSGDGEVGHMVMNPDGPRCLCGNHGCLEAYSSERSIISRAKNAIDIGDASILKEIVAENRLPSIEEILLAQSRGDGAIQNIIEDAIKYLGLAIANIDNFVRPECVAIECKLFDNDNNKRLLMNVIHKNLYREVFTDYKFSFIESDEYSGAIGAAAVAVIHNLEAYIE